MHRIISTETAFFRYALFIDLTHIIGTGCHAVLAADAFIMINENQSVGPLIRGACGTDGQAGRVVAMHALDRYDLLFDLGIWA